MWFCHHTNTDSEASSEDSQSRSRTHSITTPSPTGKRLLLRCSQFIMWPDSMFTVADSGGSRSRQSSTTSSKLQMSRESSAGEPKVRRFLLFSFPLFYFWSSLSPPNTHTHTHTHLPSFVSSRSTITFSPLYLPHSGHLQSKRAPGW